MNKYSYTSADTLPIKLLSNPELIHQITEKHYIPPYHVQLILTNACNLNCPFCSCAKEDKFRELDFKEAVNLIKNLVNLGMRSVTITGGGEPLLYPKFTQIINELHKLNVKIGIVTNGVRLRDIEDSILDKLTWCRISHSDNRALEGRYIRLLEQKIKSTQNVNWAFSYVVSPNPRISEITRVIKFANEFNFTHVRLVADLLQSSEIDLQKVKEALKIDDSKVIYQNRNTPEKGGKCWIAYLKPVIGADGKIYRCCGVQYALDPPSKNLPHELCMGSIENLKSNLSDYSTVTQGYLCSKCYYGDYNRILEMLLGKYNHKDFV